MGIETEKGVREMVEYPVILLGSLSRLIAMAALAVLVWGVGVSLVKWIRGELGKGKEREVFQRRESIRRLLGSYILLGLEILIVADIIETVIHPSLEEIAILGSIVLIRTVISVFLDREVRLGEEKTGGSFRS